MLMLLVMMNPSLVIISVRMDGTCLARAVSHEHMLDYQPNRNNNDSIKWILSPNKQFTMKSA